MHDAYLGLGSNLGDRESSLRKAVAGLRSLPGTSVVSVSKIYETPPMGPQDQGAYLNMAVHLSTMLAPERLLSECKRVEYELGRELPEGRRHWGPRTIDIDLLLYEDQVIDRPSLTLPHPGMHERWFVLRPLVDINPEARHPVLGKTAGELLQAVELAGEPRGVAL